jgi:hypothetical protein
MGFLDALRSQEDGAVIPCRQELQQQEVDGVVHWEDSEVRQPPPAAAAAAAGAHHLHLERVAESGSAKWSRLGPGRYCPPRTQREAQGCQ